MWIRHLASCNFMWKQLDQSLVCMAWGWAKHFYVKWLTIFKQATECTATQLHTINQPYLLTKSRPRYSTFTHWQDVFQPIPGLISIWVYVHIHCVEIWCPLLVCWKADIVTINNITWHHMTPHDITWHHMTPHDITWHHMASHDTIMTKHDLICHTILLYSDDSSVLEPCRHSPLLTRYLQPHRKQCPYQFVKTVEHPTLQTTC